MHTLSWATSLTAAALIPMIATAQPSCEEQHRDRVVGTVAGAGVGALLGSLIAGNGNRTAGGIVGGLGGAVLGNQISKPHGDCAHAYGFYDHDNKWHASATARADANGYYDRDGGWVAGSPDGYYDSNNHWVPGNGGANGYRDADGRWVPASAAGYYRDDGSWISNSAGGHYNERGQWTAGAATGRYDANGRWMPNSGNPQRDLNANPNSEAQSGYYDQDGHWHAGAAQGYYDTQGHWIATSAYRSQQMGPYTQPTQTHRDIAGREARLEQRIHSGLNDGSLSRYDGRRALRTLRIIQRDVAHLPQRDGRLNERNEHSIQARLDALSQSLRGVGQDGAVADNQP